MLKIFRMVYSAIVVVPLTAIGALLVFIFGLLAFLQGNRPGRGDRFIWAAQVRRLWAQSILWLHGIRIQVDGPGVAALKDPHQGLIVTSNHQSALDILAQAVILPVNSYFFAKKELLRIPLFGWGAAFAHTVYIDRSRGVKDEDSILAVRKLLERGDNLIIYPEGTRSRSRQMGRFKRGAFVIAIQLQKPLLPMTIFNSSDLMGRSNLYFKPGRLRVWVDSPVYTQGLEPKDRFELSDQVQNQILKNLDQNP